MRPVMDVLVIGPFSDDGELFWSALALSGADKLIESEGDTVSDAIRNLTRTMPGLSIALPPWMAADAKKLGVTTRLPPVNLVLGGALASMFVHEDILPLDQLGHEYPAVLLDRALDFGRSQPWEWIGQDTYLDVEYGKKKVRAEIRPSSVRVQRGSGPNSEYFGINFEPMPVLVAKAMATLGVPGAPEFFSDRPISAAEIEALIAVMDGAVELAANRSREANYVFRDQRRQVEARARLTSAGPTLAPEAKTAKVGRNEPCPCGSGLKYKKCCGAGVKPQKASEHATDERLLEQVAAYTQKIDPDFFEDKFDPLPGAEDPLATHLLTTWIYYHAEMRDGRTPLRAYLDSKPNLNPAERAWAEAQTVTHLSLLEVLSVDPSGYLELRDLLTEASYRVFDVSASKEALLHWVLVGRVTHLPDKSLLVGIYMRSLRPLQADEVREKVLRKFKKLGIPPTAQSLRGERAGRILLELSLTQTLDAHPTMLGGAVEQVTDIFEVTNAAHVKKLFNQDFMRHPVDDNRWSWLGDRIHNSIFRPKEGEVHLRGQRLTVESPSRADADRLRERVEALLGDLVQHRTRRHGQADKLQGLMPVGTLAARGPITPQGVAREQDRLWTVTPIPALNGLAPRDAMQKAASRKKLHLLLKEVTTMPKGPQTPPGLDLWAILGLDEEGQIMDMDARLPRLPRLSDTVMDWLSPELGPNWGQDIYTQAMASAVTLWNGTMDLPSALLLQDLVAKGPWDSAALQRLAIRRLALYVDPRQILDYKFIWDRGSAQLTVSFTITQKATYRKRKLTR